MARVELTTVQVPRGAACKWAFGSYAVVARVELDTTIAGVRVQTHVDMARTGRLLVWRSGNPSSTASVREDHFRARWTGVRVSADTVRRHGGPLVSACLRRAVHTLTARERRAVNEYAKRHHITARV